MMATCAAYCCRSMHKVTQRGSGLRLRSGTELCFDTLTPAGPFCVEGLNGDRSTAWCALSAQR